MGNGTAREHGQGAATGESRPRERPGPARRFQDLVAWQNAHGFALAVHSLARSFPRDERYGLSSQLRRAAVSVAANIAEGFGKRGARDNVRYVDIARGSLEECRYYLILANDLGYADPSGEMALLEEAGRVLEGYASAIRRRLDGR